MLSAERAIDGAKCVSGSYQVRCLNFHIRTGCTPQSRSDNVSFAGQGSECRLNDLSLIPLYVTPVIHCRCGEMADAQDLKSWGPLEGRVGSSPTTGTKLNRLDGNGLAQGRGETDTKTDTNFTAQPELWQKQATTRPQLPKVAAFCRFNAKRFGKRLLCRKCQVRQSTAPVVSLRPQAIAAIYSSGSDLGATAMPSFFATSRSGPSREASTAPRRSTSSR